ncbi:MAG: tetratricopeptide repeat protein [Acidobacteriota bacterium]
MKRRLCLVAIACLLGVVPGLAAQDLEELLAEPTASPFDGDWVLRGHGLRGVSAAVAGRVLTAAEGGSIAVEVYASQPPGAARLPLLVEIDGPSFLAGTSEERIRGELFAYAIDSEGVIAGHLAEAFGIDLRQLGEAVWQSGLKIFGALDLAPGTYTLRLLVRNATSGQETLLQRRIAMPADAILSFPTPDDRDSWIAIRSWSLGESDAYPFTADDGTVRSPAALPVLSTERPARGHFWGTSEDGAVELQIRAADGTVTPITAERVGGQPAALTFEVPELATGEYELALVDQPSQAIRVLILADSARERSLQWTDLRWRLDEATALVDAGPIASPDQPRKRRERKRLRQLAASYRQALEPLTENRSAAALEAVFELESQSIGSSLGSLGDGELQAARDLAGDRPATLLPLIRLHQELYRRYQGRRAYSLGSHSRLHVERLIETYLELGGEPDLGAQALATLGGHLIAAHLPASGSRLLQRARQLDAGNEAALLGLAVLFERHGAYGKARSLLDELVKAHPSHAEGRLRLAVNLARMGDRRGAAQALAGVDLDQAPPWVAALVLQERARQHLQRKDFEGALALLLRARGRLPEDPGISLLLAHVYDRQRDPARALEIVHGIRPKSDRESPRKRYDRPPEESFGRARQSLIEVAEQALPGLGEKLTQAGDRP